MTCETIWVLAEQRDGVPRDVVLEIVTAARRFARVVEGISWGAGVPSAAAALGAHGVRRLFDLGPLEHALAGPRVASAIAAACGLGSPPDAVLLPSTCDGRDVAARLSVKLDRPVLTNVVGLAEHGEGLASEHAIFGGTEIAHARVTAGPPAIFVIRPKSFVAEPYGGEPAPVTSLPAPVPGSSDRAEIVERHVDSRGGPRLGDAHVVVAGGFGLGEKANFTLVEQTARLLNGAPAASRAVVDAGWAPYGYQVGQTGKTVKPDVYLACGISGATQHLVGMQGSRHIIAINTDASAAIFRSADLGIVGDVTTILPRLIAALEARERPDP